MTSEASGRASRDLTHRVRRLSGQVAGIGRMFESGADCLDLVQQIRAAEGALRSLKRRVVARHLRECTRRVIEAGDPVVREVLLEELDAILASAGSG